MKLEGSQTEKNLYRTFAGECRARTKYNFYAEEAVCEGYRWIAEVFNQIADTEKAHAREAYRRYLNKIGDVETNLKDSIKGELEENRKVYKKYEEEAREEGFKEIADFFKELQEVEEIHAIRYSEFLKKLEENKLYKSDKTELWECMNCGYIYEGKEAPENCPLCKYPRGYFKLVCKSEII